ncbi:MAG: PolC-type DNA polymerase III N-terminal domain-containing protein, partial [Bacilli bacterium]|nr:PolC-type DNA polymerase III N-terminal domain-containing protein [Bacilli bacterium]
MQDKLKILLEKINFEDNDYSYFENAKLEKIVGNKKKTNYYFYMTIEQLLPVNIYHKFCDLLNEGFKQFELVKPIFNVLNIAQDKLRDYYNYLIEKYSIVSPLIHMFIDNHIEVKDNVLNIEVSNSAEKMKLKSITNSMIEDFKCIGFNFDDLKININEAKAKETSLEIE